MKILFMTQNEAPFRMKWMDEIAKYIDVTILHVGEYGGGVNSQYINYKPNRAYSKEISYSFFGKKLFKFSEMKKEKYDLLMLDGYGFLAQQILIIWLKIMRRPYIISVDGGFVKHEENKLKRFLKKKLISGADAYLSTSKQTDDFIKYYAGMNVDIYRHKFSSLMSQDIQDGIKENEKTALRKKLNLDDKFTIIAVGRFIPVKGFDVLLRSLEYVNADIQTIILGADEKDKYQKYLNDKNKNKVIFVGFCGKELLRDYYEASDVFVLPTRGDVWGLVVGEAMAYGLPVITTNRCLAGLEMIESGENGYIIENENAYQLADRIDELSKNQELCKRMSANNLEKIKKYAIDKAVEEDVINLKRIYEKLVEKSGG